MVRISRATATVQAHVLGSNNPDDILGCCGSRNTKVSKPAIISPHAGIAEEGVARENHDKLLIQRRWTRNIVRVSDQQRISNTDVIGLRVGGISAAIVTGVSYVFAPTVVLNAPSF